MGQKRLTFPQKGGDGLRIVLCVFLLLINTFSIAWSSPEIHINIPEYALTVTDKGQVIKKYAIAVGTPYEQTPTGKFAIFSKVENPTWYPGSKFTDRTPVPPGPDNPLGTRWMEFSPSYGIHGTNKDWDITYPVSGGCIRLHDVDARELYEIAGIGTPVIVGYETLRIKEKADGLYLVVYPDIYSRKTSTQERFVELFTPHSTSYEIIRELSFPLKDADETYEIKFASRKDFPPVKKPEPQPSPTTTLSPKSIQSTKNSQPR